MLVLLARTARAGVVAASDCLGAQRREGGDLFGEFDTETTLAGQRVIGRVEVDGDVHACCFQQVAGLDWVAGICLEPSEVDECSGMTRVADAVEQPDRFVAVEAEQGLA